MNTQRDQTTTSLHPLGPNVAAYAGRDRPYSNAAIVIGSEAILVFDAIQLRDSQRLRSAVPSTPPLRHLVLSHAHPDHTLGAMNFAPPANALAREWTCEQLKAMSQGPAPSIPPSSQPYPGADVDLMSSHFVVPKDIVEDGHSIELGGGVRVLLNPVQIAHTPGDLWGFVEPDGVVLCGDLWFNRVEPFLADGSLEGSMHALEHLRAVEGSVYLPGHGPPGRLGDMGTEMMDRFCRWLEQQLMLAVDDGLDLLAAQARIRARFEEQAAGTSGIKFSISRPGRLEASVEGLLRRMRPQDD
jgi:glyoxylase-like metal-dependent hydrolase (beta-lactamase superfamily II)